MNKFDNINSKIKIAIDNWNKLEFSKLSRIENKGNTIRFLILTYDNNSYNFVRDINDLLKNKHPYGELIFSGHDDIMTESSSTNFKVYKITVFKDTNIEEDEYLEKLLIFYENLSNLIKKYIERK